MIVGPYLVKTCWVLEGASLEEPEPMLLEVIENDAGYAEDGAGARKNSSESKES